MAERTNAPHLKCGKSEMASEVRILSLPLSYGVCGKTLSSNVESLDETEEEIYLFAPHPLRNQSRQNMFWRGFYPLTIAIPIISLAPDSLKILAHSAMVAPVV